jgi:hypothetical protein
MEWLVVVGILDKDVLGQDGICLIKCLLVAFLPLKLDAFGGKLIKWVQDVRSLGKEFPIEGDSTYEAASIADVTWLFYFEDGLNFLAPWPHSSRSEPITKPVSFFDCPLAFERVDCEVVVLQPREYLIQSGKVLTPRVGEATYII